MALARGAPRCFKCGEHYKGKYTDQSDTTVHLQLIGDTFIGWDIEGHTCSEHLDIKLQITMNKNDLKIIIYNAHMEAGNWKVFPKDLTWGEVLQKGFKITWIDSKDIFGAVRVRAVMRIGGVLCAKVVLEDGTVMSIGFNSDETKRMDVEGLKKILGI